MNSVMADPAARQMKVNADRIRMQNRAAFRAEQLLPNVRWRAFREQQRHEDLAASRFERKQSWLKAKKNGNELNPILQRFFERLRRSLDRRVREIGGTEETLLRSCFSQWDANACGTLNRHGLRRSLQSIGFRLEEAECDSLLEYYDRSRNVINYNVFCEDVVRFCRRHFLHHPEPKEVTQLLGETPRSDPSFSLLVQRFIRKLRKKLGALIKRNGEYERILIRRALLAWDPRSRGKLKPQEFVGAMKQLGLTLAVPEAEEIVAAFDYSREGEMTYQPLIEAVCQGLPHFTEIPESVDDANDHTNSFRHQGRNVLAVRRTREEVRRTNNLECSRTPDDMEDEKLLSTLFTARPPGKVPNAVVEKFKVALRNRLEDRVLLAGGTVESILREAFQFWDRDASGSLSVREFCGAMSRIGMSICCDQALQLVRYYNRNRNSSMREADVLHYADLMSDIARGTPNFIAHPTSRRIFEGSSGSLPPMPSNVCTILKSVRDGVSARLPSVIATQTGQSPGARDLLLGTCLRIDRSGVGKLTKQDLTRILREFRVEIRDGSLDDLVAWYDCDGSSRIPYRNLVNDAFSPCNMLTEASFLNPQAAQQEHVQEDIQRNKRKQLLEKSSSLPVLRDCSTGLSTPLNNTARVSIARIAAERETILRRLKQLQYQQVAEQEQHQQNHKDCQRD